MRPRHRAAHGSSQPEVHQGREKAVCQPPPARHRLEQSRLAGYLGQRTARTRNPERPLRLMPGRTRVRSRVSHRFFRAPPRRTGRSSSRGCPPCGAAAGFIAGGHPGGETAQLEGELDHLADLPERHIPAARVGGQLQPTAGFVEDALEELEFGLTQPLEVRGGAGGTGADQQVQSVLRGIGKPRLEGGDASRPVELGGEAADSCRANGQSAWRPRDASGGP